MWDSAEEAEEEEDGIVEEDGGKAEEDRRMFLLMLIYTFYAWKCTFYGQIIYVCMGIKHEREQCNR